MRSPPISRRLVLASSLASCVRGTAARAAAFDEAPMLKARTAAGQLPPVAARLPAKPKIVPVNAAIGQYGGTWRMSMAGATDIFSLVRMIGYENLTRWKPWSQAAQKIDVFPDVEPNLADSVDIEDAGRTYIFHLRPGMRWSDGHPFGADDIMFWYADVFSNSELFGSKPIWAVRGNKPLVVEKRDDATVVFRFEQPEGLLMQWLATPAINIEPNVPTGYPKHYLSQFHKTYTPAVANGPDWVRQFHDRANKWSNPEVPTQPDDHPRRWRGQRRARDGGTQSLYWKVDSAGPSTALYRQRHV